MVGFGWGLGVFAGVYVAYRSGAHLNPAVTVGILTSGGDCPGLNAVIRGIVLKGTTLFLLIATIFAGEGVVCVLFAAPLVYAVALLVAALVNTVRKGGRGARASCATARNRSRPAAPPRRPARRAG